MRAGPRRHRFIVEQPKKAALPGNEGHVDQTEEANWTFFCAAWFSMKNVGVREVPSPDSEQTIVLATYLLETAFDTKTSQIDDTMRLVRKRDPGPPLYLNVEKAFDPDLRRRQIMLTCVEKRT